MNTVRPKHLMSRHMLKAESASSSQKLVHGGVLSVLLCSALLFPSQATAAESEVNGNGSLVVTGTTAVAKDGTSYTLADDACVYGNRGNGDITGASLSIDGNNALGEYVAGGFSNYDAATGGNTSNNTVTVTNSTAQMVCGGQKGEKGEEEAEDPTKTWNCSSNTVTVTDSEFSTVYGGLVPTSGKSDNNTVTVSNCTGESIFGGTIFDEGTSSGNTLHIQDTAVWITAGGVVNGSGDASGNSVTFSGGSAGRADMECGYIAGGASWSGNAVNNTVTLLGSPDLSYAVVYGGFSEDDPLENDLRSGNKLHVQTSSAITVKDIRNFETVNVTVPSLSKEYKSKAFITLTNETGTDLSKSVLTVTVDSVSDSLTLANGDRFMLVKNSNGLTLGKYSVNEIEVQHASQLSELGVLKPEKTKTSLDLVMSGSGGSATEQAAVLSEAHAAGGAMVLAGADMATGPGMSAAMHAFDKKEVPYGLAVFGAVSGASQRYNLESHIDLHSVSLIAGPVFAAATGCGRLTAGAFFEYGAGSYGAEHDMRGPELNGDGNLSYMGAGLLARLDLPSTGSGNVYLEVSGRAGTLRNSFESKDGRLRNVQTGRTLEYDMDMAYQSLHGSVGYLWDIADNLKLDLSGTYMWSHVYDDAVTSSTGGRIEYDDFTSNRVRVGARLSYEGSEIWKPYIGAAYEHEFDGEAKVRANGYDTDTSDLKGSTAIGELGLSLTSESAGIPLTIDLTVQGFAGKRQGIAGNLMVLYEF